uniref:DUF6827 domain-containing protein n=1 Tax=Chromera velia CCMP2878 TaxID=1169474 RepID=A0A0G4HJX0_9ALVE|eukprot:Cvel_7193.t1-p1 / transcript=Cvel_7193.t1 / gene=Cvel_7193 / organism=Chromera_velia_CCMP2878 / gene_product=hypothetical protein / transcript_product=hypothetical protein / location=Cvel_scaffold370:15721-18004(+) / protein_length=180 / sequence_SO=supercontig / SO=protein_coding / is_pseudo=false
MTGTITVPCQKFRLPSSNRNFSTAAQADSLTSRIDALSAEVLSTNWGDNMALVHNVPFWEAELERLQVEAMKTTGAPEAKLKELNELFDLLFQAEDVRDHLNELGEEKGRASGLAGTGVKAGEDVENMEENLGACVSAYEALVKRYPSFAIKTEEAVGNGLRALRSKKKFRYEQMHKHFF